MDALIKGLLSQRLVVFLVLVVALGVGLMTAPFDWDLGPLTRAPVAVDAIPDIGEAQQIVATEWPGRSPQDIEDQITYPLTVRLLGVPGVARVRSSSMFGVSFVTCVMDEGVDFYWVRSRILEKLTSLPRDLLPPGVSPALGPDATALGQVFWYTLEGRTPDGKPAGGWGRDELRTIQDFLVKPALSAARGVSEVASIGGFQREYQVDVDADAMRHFGVSLDEVLRAVRSSNRDVGANTLELNRIEYVIRGIGTLRSLDDLRNVVVRATDGVPTLLADVAEVRFGPAQRRGALDKDGAEAVGGVAVVRYGDNPLKAIQAVKRAIADLAPGLPARVLEDGTRSQVTVVPFYDRTGLIEETLETLESALIDQVLVTVLVVVLMLFHMRASLVVSVLLPTAVLLTFALMKAFGVAANVVALAGIAIAIGTMVDVGIVVTENVLARIRDAPPDEPRLVSVRHGVLEVAGAVLTAVATTIVSFLPVFALTAAEGKLFSPLAWTKTLALCAAAFVAIVVLPAALALLFPKSLEGRLKLPRAAHVVLVVVVSLVCTWLLADHWRPLGPGVPMADNLMFVVLVVGGFLGLLWLFRWGYEPMLRWCLRYRLLFALVPVAIVFFGVTAWRGADKTLGWLPDEMTAGARAKMPGMSGGWLPDLDEGDFLFMPSALPQASLGATLEAMQTIDRRIAALPEVEHAVGKLGRADTALDPAPLSMIETLVTVKPEWSIDADGKRVRNWRPEIRSREDVWNAIAEAGDMLELSSASSLQPIRTRIVMLQTGMKGDMGIRIQGPDLVAVEQFGVAVETLLNDKAKRARAVRADRMVGKPYLEVRPDMAAAARYGLVIDDVQRAIETAIGGATVTRTIEGRESFGVRVRYPHERRLSPEAIGEVMLSVPGRAGVQVPLSAIATVEMTTGPQAIKSENTFMTAYVTFAAAEKKPDPAAQARRATEQWVGPKQTWPLSDVMEQVDEVLRSAIADGRLAVPDGVSWGLAGDWEQKERSDDALAVLIPLALIIIVILLQLQLKSFATTLMVASGVAVALGGGMLMVWAWGQPGFLDFELFGQNMRDVFHVTPIVVNVAVAIGFIALIGIATDDGVVMATYLRQRFEANPPTDRAGVIEAVVDAGKRRIRPCLMTTATTVLALLPVLTSTGKGADVMVPMAIPAFGGMVFELVTLFVVPVLYASWAMVRLPAHRNPGQMAEAAQLSLQLKETS